MGKKEIAQRPAILGTHSGTFHADDVFSIAALTLLHPDHEIRRSRDPAVWEGCDYLVDVGGVYEPERGIYDHHFPDGPTYEDGLPYSSIGLVWRHHGAEICGEEAAAWVREALIRGLDAHDNGINLVAPIEGAPKVAPISLSGLIAAMNPPDLTEVDAVFEAEVRRAAEILKAYIADAEHWLGCREEVATALEAALTEGRRYMEVGENCAWMGHLMGAAGNEPILYVLYPSDGNWYARTVPERSSGFNSRKRFPEAWAGLRDEAFSEAAGIEDGIFCHHKRFICGARSKASILRLVEAAIAG